MWKYPLGLQKELPLFKSWIRLCNGVISGATVNADTAKDVGQKICNQWLDKAHQAIHSKRNPRLSRLE